MAYKDSLFRSIFNNEKSALALYRAVCGESCGAEGAASGGGLGSGSAASSESRSAGSAEIVMTTLAETLWTPRKNDLSFTVNGSLVVIAEHQSTINKNMPYRMLQYVCRLFESGITDKKDVYRKALVRHPRPRFIVFFNGAEPCEDYSQMLLSDSYEAPLPGGYAGRALELAVDVYNVNEGRNSAIMGACEELKGYAFFVSRAKRLEKEITARSEGLSRGETTLKAIRQAIRDCKEAGLLAEFWEKMSQEDVNMLANDWNFETALEVEREEGFEKGIEMGMGRGIEAVAANALAKGLSFELIREITGLDAETIAGLSQRAL